MDAPIPPSDQGDEQGQAEGQAMMFDASRLDAPPAPPAAQLLPSGVPGQMPRQGPLAVPYVLQPRMTISGSKDDVQRLLGAALVVKCDPGATYAAPCITLAGEQSTVYSLIERFMRPEFLFGGERFWKLIRTELACETWRPRVQGAQVKALQGARLAETDQELARLDQVIYSLADCLKLDYTAATFAHEARSFVRLTQVWWDNRNKRPEGGCAGQAAGAAVLSNPPRRGRAAGMQQLAVGVLAAGGAAQCQERSPVA